MYSTVEVIEPAKDQSLLSLYETRLMLNLTSENEMLDDQLEMIVEWSSAEIAALCNRIFARETVVETFYDVDPNLTGRLFLSHYPVQTISSIDWDGDILGTSAYALDKRSGAVIPLGEASWSAPLSITYTGGYELPFEAPMALKQATLLMAREAYYAQSRGDASVRMISHKESRIIYFDPNAKSAATASGGSPARRAAGDLLKKFTQFWI